MTKSSTETGRKTQASRTIETRPAFYSSVETYPYLSGQALALLLRNNSFLEGSMQVGKTACWRHSLGCTT